MKKNKKEAKKQELARARQEKKMSELNTANAIATWIQAIFAILAFLLALATWLGIKPPIK